LSILISRNHHQCMHITTQTNHETNEKVEGNVSMSLSLYPECVAFRILRVGQGDVVDVLIGHDFLLLSTPSPLSLWRAH